MAKGNANSSPGCPAAAAPPPASPLSASSGLQPPHARPASSSSQPRPSSLTPPDRVGQAPEPNSEPRVEQLVGQPLTVCPSALVPLLLLHPPSVDPVQPNANHKSSVPEQEQWEGEGLADCNKTVASDIRPTAEKAVRNIIPEKDPNTPVPAATECKDGTESEASVEIVEPLNQEVINVDDWDSEELVVIEPQESISRDWSSAGNETSRQKEDR